jgi:serralysin
MATTNGGDGDDFVVGEGGIDLAICTDATGGISANLDDGIVFGGSVGLDLLLSIERTGDTSASKVSDPLFGQSDADRFVYTDAYGVDTQGDFFGSAGGQHDLVDLTGTEISSFADVMSQSSQVGADVLIDFGGGNTLTLQNTFIASLQDDFIF